MVAARELDDPAGRVAQDVRDGAIDALGVEEALRALASSAEGLASEEAERRLAAHGLDRLPEARRRNTALRFLAQFHNAPIHGLIASSAVAAAPGRWIDAGVIRAVVLVNALIGYIQEGRAEQAMEAIRDMRAPRSAGLRDGRRVGVDMADLAPGDVALVEAGDRAPADLRLIESRALRAQEAILAGESAPVPADAALGDRRFMLFLGTLIAAGAGRGVVAATGRGTEIGRISGMLSAVERLTTPLVGRTDRFAHWLTAVILGAAGVLLAYGHGVGGMPFPELLMAVVGLSVAAIPEGLPAALTITLAVGVQAMARRNAIIRRLPAIETLGSVSVIRSDKTGARTRNEMTATHVAAAGRVRSVPCDGHAPEGAAARDDRDAASRSSSAAGAERAGIARAAWPCNDAVLQAAGGDWRSEGDPMDGALRAMGARIIGARRPMRARR